MLEESKEYGATKSIKGEEDWGSINLLIG